MNAKNGREGIWRGGGAVLALMVASVTLLGLVPQAGATPAGGGATSSAEHCTTYNISKITAVLNAGTEEICVIFDTDTPHGTSPYVRLRASGPDNALGLAFTQTWSIIGGTTTGCTAGTLTQSNGASAATSWANAYFMVTFNAGSTQCAGMAQYTLVVASVPILTWQGGWDTDVESQASYVFLCDHTSTTSQAQDPDAATCNTLSENNALSGTVNAALSGTVNAALSGTVNAALSGTVNAALSGTVNAALSGSLALQESEKDSSSQSMVKTCTPARYVQAAAPFAVAGLVQGCITYPPLINPSAGAYPAVHMLATSSFPALATDTIGTSTPMAANTVSGCTITPGSQSYNPSNGAGGATNGAGGYTVYRIFDIALTAATCSGYIRTNAVGIPGTDILLQMDLPFQIRTDTQQQIVEACTAGNYDQTLGRFTACSNPTLNAVNSGTTHLVIDSWPSLTAAVTNSGTINVVNSGGQTFTVSGSLAVTNSGSLAVSGGLTVTDDANGWSLNVASWPQLQAILSGEVHPCSTAARLADPNACHLDTTAANVNNTVGAVMVPSTFHLCGQELVPGDCTPIKAQSAIGFTDAASGTKHGLDFWVQLLFFLGVLMFGYWQRLKMIMGWAVPGILLTLFPNFGWSFEFGILAIMVGVLHQFFSESLEEQKEERGEGAVVN